MSAKNIWNAGVTFKTHYQKSNGKKYLVSEQNLTIFSKTMKILENNLLYNFLSVQNPKKHILHKFHTYHI